MKRFLAIVLASIMLLAMAPAAVAENAIIYEIADDPEQMDPTLNSYSRSSMVLQQLFRGLYKLNSDGSGFIPCLAESYEVSEDQLTYTFKLKEDLKWSDGSPLTAADFEYSWKRVLNPDVASRAQSDMWVLKNGRAYANGECSADEVGVTAVDDTTLVVELEALTPWFISLTAITSYFPVKKEVVEAEEPWTRSPETYISSGPFMLEEISSLAYIRMVKNPYYVDADDVQTDTLTYMIIPDAATVLTAYNNGEINVADNLSSDAIAQYKDTDEFSSIGRIGIQYCDFNCDLPEFSDKRVRQAFAISIDRQAVLNALRITEPVIYGFIPYSQPSLTDPDKSYRDIAGDMFEMDVAKAQQLMADAGYPAGEGFPTVEIVTRADNEQRLMAQILGEMWKANLGVDYSITTYESATYWDELEMGNFSVDRNGYTCDYLDPVANLKIFVTGSNAYENNWDDPVFDAMIDATDKESDPAKREQLIIEAEKYLIEEMPAMPMYSYEDTFLVKPGVNGVIKNAIGHINFEYATFE
ncbi:MAG: peptide ABC transporter substrate-binding protein [Clostridia bacterium]|nr:peptide ABC transporter substrate-binding protein [Clostridia bacterium]